MGTPHDNLFHFTFGKPRHARGWILYLLGARLAGVIDWGSLRVAPERLDAHDLRLHVADVVMCADLRPGPVVHLLLEHTSGAAGALRRKLLRYAVHLADAGGLLLVFVLYHGERPWRDGQYGALSRPGLDRRAVRALVAMQARIEFLLDELTKSNEADLRRCGLTALAQLTLLCLRFLRWFGVAEALAAIERWGDLLRAIDGEPEDGPDAIERIACYFLRVSDVPAESLHAAFERTLHRPEESIMSTAEKLLKEGESRGEARGEARGEVRGEVRGAAKRLLQLVQRKFGPIPESVVQRIHGAELPDLDRWFDRILDARSLDEVLA